MKEVKRLMAQPWETWTEQEWLSSADQYHGARLTAEAWEGLPPSKRLRALNSARSQLAAWVDNPAYPMAVHEQALWLTTEQGVNAINDYASISIGEGSISVSYGRARSGKKPEWMSPLAWGLLGMGSARPWSAGRVV